MGRKKNVFRGIERTMIERETLLRKKAGYTQKQLAEILARMDNSRNYSNQTVSLWEQFVFPIPPDVVPFLCEIFGCTKEYLMGTSNAPDKTFASPHESVTLPAAVCVNDRLFELNGLPVYVEFLSPAYGKNQWGVYSRENDTIYFVNLRMTEVSKKIDLMNLYTQMPLYEIVSNAMEIRISSIKDMLNYNYVYVKYSSPYKEIRDVFAGVYRVDAEKGCLINDTGCTLPFSGLNITYSAYVA